MADSTIVFLVLVGLVAVLVVDRVPDELVALSAALMLWATDVLELDQVLAGFGNPTVIFVASLLVVAAALDATGLTAWGGQLLVAASRGRPRRLTIATMVVVALLTSVITVHGAVAAMIPVVVATGARLGIPASKLLLPLAFAAHAGSQLTLTGSQVNILYSEAARDAGAGYFGYFEYALIGLPLLGGTIVIVATLGPRLLPHRADDRPREATTELFVPVRSALIGSTVRTDPEPSSEHGVSLVVHRDGVVEGDGSTTIVAGDVLLVRGDWRDLGDGLVDADVLVVDPPDESGPHLAPWGPGARRTLAIVAALVVMLATGVVPPAVAGLIAAGALVFTGVLGIDAAYRGINWSAVVLIAAMIPISTAMNTSGAADDIAEAITRLVGDAGPYVLLTVLFVVVATLTQVMSNTATALVAIPIGVAAAADLDISVQPVLMSLNAVTVAALMTPVATASNTMVMRAGGYRFVDYGKLGVPLLAWWFVIAVGLVPLIWRF